MEYSFCSQTDGPINGGAYNRGGGVAVKSLSLIHLPSKLCSKKKSTRNSQTSIESVSWQASKLRIHCSVLDISLAGEKNFGMYCLRSAF